MPDPDRGFTPRGANGWVTAAQHGPGASPRPADRVWGEGKSVDEVPWACVQPVLSSTGLVVPGSSVGVYGDGGAVAFWLVSANVASRSRAGILP